jgi:hypothetical protein
VEAMTSETWFVGGHEVERIAIGAAVRRSVASWGGGHVDALVNIRGPRPVVELAVAYPFTRPDFSATRRLQAALERVRT